MVVFLFLVLKRIKKNNGLKINIVITVGHHVPLVGELGRDYGHGLINQKIFSFAT